MKIGIVQQHNTADVADNMRRLAASVEQLAQEGAQLVVLQELHNSLYFCQTEDVANFDLAESIPGPSTQFYGELAKRLGVVIVTSLFERRSAGLYHNTAVVIERDGTIAGKYRKMHIPDDPAYYEKFYFTPGDLGFRPIDTSVGRLGVLVCWDQWYPEAARLMALQGAEILIFYFSSPLKSPRFFFGPSGAIPFMASSNRRRASFCSSFNFSGTVTTNVT